MWCQDMKKQLAEAQADIRALTEALADALREIHINLGCDPRCEELRHSALARPGVKRVMETHEAMRNPEAVPLG